ncbi:MAG: nucleoside-diphosphate sugar epimerase/dehydratase [Bacteroidota bacterium]
MVTETILKLKILPRWVIILIDASIVAFSTLLGYLLRFNFNWEAAIDYNLISGICLSLVAFIGSTLLTKSYSGIVRYTGVHDGKRLLTMLLVMAIALFGANYIYLSFEGQVLLPFSVALISLLANFLFLFQYRLLIKNIFSYYRTTQQSKKSICIYGAGELGILTQSILLASSDTNYKIEAFFEDDPRKVGKVINGVKILKFHNFLSGQLSSRIDELIIATSRLSLSRTNDIVDACLDRGIKVRSAPSIDQWVKGEFSIKEIKSINIEDLLGRESISLNNDAVAEEIQYRCVCVTGAAGSIGSELVRQLINFSPNRLILIDQNESPLYELQREIEGSCLAHVYVADIKDSSRIRKIFKKELPAIVFHAAAYKHVPLMEHNVIEAIKTNLLGTRNLANISNTVGVKKFVMVSTDKAVKPTSVMGCSKRLAEMYVQSYNNYLSLSHNEHTVFVTTRFGNVLGSNGSVIPFFKKQISNGGPITVTHPEITRYFMTIPEACQLILEAGTMGKGGEIFIFDMGQSVKIVDLAKKMIQLSGLELGKDIEIIFTGLREGEKLYEELLADGENTLPTHHKKIMIAKVAQYDYEVLDDGLSKLVDQIDTKTDFDLIEIMKGLLPEYSQVLTK